MNDDEHKTNSSAANHVQAENTKSKDLTPTTDLIGKSMGLSERKKTSRASSLRRRLKQLLLPGETLSQRVVHGGIWVFALRITDRLFGLTRTIVLARLLAPADFGLFGIALLAMSALETFSQTGFQQALIQKKGDTKPYLDTAWTVQAIRGILMALILFAIAPYVAAFFEAPAAKPILQVISLSVLFRGFTNIGVLYFQKELEFHKQFVYMFSGTLVDVGVAISAAFLLRSVWALVFGVLAGNFVRMVVSYFVHPYRPRLRFEGAKAKELYTFGRWIFGSSILVFLLNEGDDIFLGKVLGTTALGLYQMAYRISNLPATEITHTISQVTFPAYSKLQDRLPQLRQAYLQTLQVVAFLSFPMAGGIAFLAPDFTRLFLGEKWMPMVPAMQVLAIWGLIRSISATTGPLFQAVGRPGISTRLQFARLGLLIVLIYPLTVQWGIMGTTLAVVFSALLVDPIAEYMVFRIIRCRVWQLIKVIVVPMLGTGVMWIGLTMLKRLLLPTTGLSLFIMSIVVGALIYAGAMALFDRWFVCETGSLLKRYILNAK